MSNQTMLAPPTSHRGECLRRVRCWAALLTAMVLNLACARTSVLDPGNGEKPPPTIPEPPDDSCASLGFEYTACDTCQTLECTCDPPIPLVSIPTICVADRCPSKVSCAAVCAEGEEKALGCLLGASECREDHDCQGGGKCVVDSRIPEGECATGLAGARCRDSDDCWSHQCVAVAPNGKRACSNGAPGDPCNDDVNCAAGVCARPRDGFIGGCSSGTEGEFCYDNVHCANGLACIAPSAAGLPSVCSSGALMSACRFGTDCRQGFCGDGRCTSGEMGAPCQSRFDCLSGFCDWTERKCSTGESGADCGNDADCRSAKCAILNLALMTPGICTDGRDGEPCVRDGQCESMHCAILPGQVATGLCTRRAKGDPCFVDMDCQSAFCRQFAPTTWCPRCAFPCAERVLVPCDNGGFCAYGDCIVARCDSPDPDGGNDGSLSDAGRLEDAAAMTSP